MGPGTQLAPAVHVHHEQPWERRDLLGVHAQKQPGLSWVGASVPAGRLQSGDMEVRAGGWGAVLACMPCCCVLRVPVF